MSEAMLSADQERFAAAAVAAGRYPDTAAVIRAGVDLLRQAEAELAAFLGSLETAEAAGERDGFLESADVHREMVVYLEELARAER
jgi:putative addiction module CopG family antidote